MVWCQTFRLIRQPTKKATAMPIKNKIRSLCDMLLFKRYIENSSAQNLPILHVGPAKPFLAQTVDVLI